MDFTRDWELEDALLVAAEFGKAEPIKVLIAAGVDVVKTDGQIYFILHRNEAVNNG